MNENDLLKKLAELPKEIEPEHDPWAKIETRIGGDEDRRAIPAAASSEPPSGARHSRWPLRAVAALAVAAIAVALLRGPQTAPPVEQGLAAAEPPATLLMAGMMAGSEAEYQAAFREFIAIGDSRDNMASAEVEKIESGWAHLLQVEHALADALAQNPDDPFLNRKMLDLRARQLGFLRQIASIDHSNRRMTI